MRTRHVTCCGLLAAALVLGAAGTLAPRSNAACADDRSAPRAPAAKLDEDEASLKRRYEQFEKTLLQMAEYLRRTEPERAELLMRAIGKSKERRVSQQMDQISELLKADQFGDAIGKQEHLVTDLHALLELLQSEDRRHQLEEEKKRYELLEKEVGKLAAREKDLRRTTEGARNLAPLAERQRGLRDDAQKLVERIDRQDSERNAGDRQPSDRSSKNRQQPGNAERPKRGDKNAKPEGSPDSKEKPDADKDRDSKNQDSKKADKDKPPSNRAEKDDRRNKKADSDQSPGRNAKDQDRSGDRKSPKEQSRRNQTDKNPPNPQGSKTGDSNNRQPRDKQAQRPRGNRSGEPQPPQDSPDSPPQEADDQQQRQEERIPPKTPGRDEIEKARRAMQQAEDELKKLRGTEARERQEEAIRQLEKAKERLEKILRQLREEEQEIMLASLEARFARMLLMEMQIQADTITLDKTKKADWTARHFGRSRELSVTQEAIADDAAKALTLLKEEGSSIAFPKGVEQVRDDMLQIARWLGSNDVGQLTQQVEKDVIESLEEMVASLQAEIENRKKPENQRQRRRQQGQAGEREKQLVEQLAELKMLRSLQLRINRRTKEIGRRIKGEQAASDELNAYLRKLAQQQAEIQEATYILSSGRNQ